MFRFPLVLLFVAMTFCCWGTYGPVLHEGQMAMEFSRWRPFICVGVAYFMVAVVVPFLIGRAHRESGGWTMRGILWSLVAGAVGALGSLGIIIAFALGGRPIYVMPLVFGCAPVVNTFVTMLMTHVEKRPGWIFYLGIVMVALGGAGVLTFKPKPVQADAAHAAFESLPVQRAQVGATEESAPLESAAAPAEAAAEPRLSLGGLVGRIATIIMTILCWGSYGPMLHRGQARMGGSRLRPFMCVGMAYFLVAIVIPLMILYQFPEPGRWTVPGSLWSLLAGALGAVGALGIIMAFNFGGRPVYVMPLVFGGAPVINTFSSMFKSYVDTGIAGTLSSQFMVSLCLVIAGAATVLVFAPKPPKPAADEPLTDVPAAHAAVASDPGPAAGPGPAADTVAESAG